MLLREFDALPVNDKRNETHRVPNALGYKAHGISLCQAMLIPLNPNAVKPNADCK